MAAIRQLAREIADKFRPERIVLFGSYAYGKPHEDSDVDILVIMPARNELDQAVKSWAICSSSSCRITNRCAHSSRGPST